MTSATSGAPDPSAVDASTKCARSIGRLTGGAPLRYISPYHFFPAMRLSIDAYPRRRNARSIPSS
jgi:hypothetical protein